MMAGRDYEEYEEMSALEALPGEGLPYYPPRFSERGGEEEEGQQRFNRSLRDDTLYGDAVAHTFYGDDTLDGHHHHHHHHQGGFASDEEEPEDDMSRYPNEEDLVAGHLPPSQQYLRNTGLRSQQGAGHSSNARHTGGGGAAARMRGTGMGMSATAFGSGAVGGGMEMMAGPEPQSRDPRWITVFGFPRSRTIEILHTFRQYGEFLHTRQAATGNWIHICYSTKLQAEKALSKNGKIIKGIEGDLMIGVVSCSEENEWLRPPLSSAALRPVLPPSNPFAQPSPHAQQSLSSQLLPQSSSSFWSSFFTYVFGL